MLRFTFWCKLAVWRQDELTLINETTTGPERKAALCQLLEKEAQLIASIGRHKIVAGRDIKEKQIRAFLNAVNVLKECTTAYPTDFWRLKTQTRHS